MRRVLAAMLAATLTATVIALSSCSPLTPGQQLSMLERSTLVCVDNPSIHSMRVEFLDSQHGSEHGEMWVRAGHEECEFMDLSDGMVDARIKSVSVKDDVIPPAWEHMLVGDVLKVRVGSDGLTPFAHSSRVQ